MAHLVKVKDPKKKTHPTKPSKFNAAQLDDFITNLSIGITEANSAMIAFDVDERTYYRWLSDKSPLIKSEKGQLLHAIAKGRAKINQRLALLVIKDAEQGDGRLALDFMKRLERKAYGDEVKNKLASDPDDPLKVIIEDYGVTHHATAKTEKGA